MNKRGGSFLLSILIFFILFAAGVMFINFVTTDIDSVRTSQNLNCDSNSISDGAKVTCLGIDLVVPYIIVSMISLGGALIVNKINI